MVIDYNETAANFKDKLINNITAITSKDIEVVRSGYVAYGANWQIKFIGEK